MFSQGCGCSRVILMRLEIDPSERRNSEFVASNAAAFNRFIEVADLVEYQMGGGSFTYVSDHGGKFSKLDRFLVCRGFMSGWSTATLIVLAKEYLDHRLVVLSSVDVDFGHLPFRFFNSWLQLPGFVTFVEEECKKFKFSGPADLALATKLKWLKKKIKIWLADFNKARDGELLFKTTRIRALESDAKSRQLTGGEMEEKAECLMFVQEVESQKMKDLQQKAKVRWAVHGDENSSYFHGLLKANLTNNRLHGLIDGDGNWIDKPIILKNMVFDFFAQRFEDPWVVQPGFACPELPGLRMRRSLLWVRLLDLK
ncbi:uncharacterized protein LOC143576132 [Bidens hawaiensis]|uniref:uncharacterized protein LOC143576132 n=1 Tax=Bidens hawaiensis TaxID=980011 RepID=UPI00404A6F59